MTASGQDRGNGIRDIDTFNDIVSFDIMIFAGLLGHATSGTQFGNDLWKSFVQRFYDGDSFPKIGRPRFTPATPIIEESQK